MKRKMVQKTLLILVGALAVAGATSLPVASATMQKSAARPPDAVLASPPDAVLTWNTNAVNAVRASSPAKFQTEGFVYMSYVQAAVYDAVLLHGTLSLSRRNMCAPARAARISWAAHG